MNTLDELSKERKDLIKQGNIPEWYITPGWQMFKTQYLSDTDEAVRGQFKRIAKTLAKHLKGTPVADIAAGKFFDLLWDGIWSPATPVLANTGTKKGFPVSCSGTIIEDSVDGFYRNLHEVAMLTKYGFGTASDFSNIRPLGSDVSTGGKANGVLPVLAAHIQVSKDIAQGSTRRGAFAGYLDIEHEDFWDVIKYVQSDADKTNVGWIVKDSFVEKLKSDDEEAQKRWAEVLFVRLNPGRGYIFFPDKANRKRPKCYVDRNLLINNSQLCTEIMLHNSKDETYTCVLSSLNVVHWDKIKDSDAAYWITLALDCIVSEFLETSKGTPGFERARLGTERGRPVGLGICGLHSLFLDRMIPFGSFEAHMLNLDIAEYMSRESLRASMDLAKWLGEPEYCKGYGVRNTHRCAIAPTKSTALLMGGVSEGVSPQPAFVFTQPTAAGKMHRVDPSLIKMMKYKGVYNQETIDSIVDKQGSVQHCTWLTEYEKEVFKTAFEINQKDILRLASTRAKYIDQGQSLNLYFHGDEDEETISEIHRIATEDENILSLYYVSTLTGIQASKANQAECTACQ